MQMSFNFTVVSLISGVLHVTKWFEFTLLLISWWSVRVSANQDLQTSLHAIHLRDVTTFLTLLTGLGQLTSGYVCYTSIFYIHFTYQIQMLFYDNNYHLLRFFLFWGFLTNFGQRHQHNVNVNVNFSNVWHTRKFTADALTCYACWNWRVSDAWKNQNAQTLTLTHLPFLFHKKDRISFKRGKFCHLFYSLFYSFWIRGWCIALYFEYYLDFFRINSNSEVTNIWTKMWRVLELGHLRKKIACFLHR